MIDTIVSSSALIVIILIIRFVFKGRINPMVQYGLWSLVVLRLAVFNWLSLHPIESALSFMNLVNRAESTIRGAASAELVIPGDIETGAIGNTVPNLNNVQTGNITGDEAISATAGIDMQIVIMTIWAIGVLSIIFWLIHVNRKFGKKIYNDRKLLIFINADNQGKLSTDEIGFIHKGTEIKNTKLLPVYVVNSLDSPCLMRYKRETAIYIPYEVAADKEKLRFAIAHELCHYKHYDLIWAIVRGGMLAFYWFNPLVWVAAIMSKRDCELACDYSVLKLIRKEYRLAYGRTLVDLIRQSNHKGDILQVATTMYGSANGIKERISMIAKNKKMRAVSLISVLLIAALAVGCTFTSAPNMENPSNTDAEIEAIAVKWADAFSERDADTIYSLSKNEEVYLTVGEIGENEEGKYYWMGLSSPWPWDKDYVIDIEDNSTIQIYYYFRTSDPAVYVMKETISVEKIEGEYKVVEETQKHFDTIESKADFEEAYKFGFPDFTKFADAYQTQADENIRNMAAILENPVNAAMHQLNLAGAEVAGTYEDPNTEPPMAVVKFKWNDGEVEVKLIQPIFIDENGAERKASIWVVVNEDYDDKNPIRLNTASTDYKCFEQISAYMEEESKKVFSPYYELLDFQVSDYHEEIINGKVEAAFDYKIIHKNYDRDPDTVKYIKEAKESGNKNYQQMYDEYLQPKEMNFELKAVIDNNDTITLYSNVAPKGVKWEETKMSDFIMK